jgi:hypothetical protein
LRIQWPKEIKLEVIHEALNHGSSTRILGSQKEAKLFRFSLYRFIRDNSQAHLAISIEDNKVILVKTPEIKSLTQKGTPISCP